MPVPIVEVKIKPSPTSCSIELFHSLTEAQVLIEDWRCHYNTRRPQSLLDNRPRTPEAILATSLAHTRPESNLTSGTDSGGRPRIPLIHLKANIQ
ncbi:MAG: transposase [Chloroflexi bacterium]|nr:transposase [Chloroflexota bacterium]